MLGRTNHKVHKVHEEKKKGRKSFINDLGLLYTRKINLEVYLHAFCKFRMKPGKIYSPDNVVGCCNTSIAFPKRYISTRRVFLSINQASLT
jgi:hypothetical protein